MSRARPISTRSRCARPMSRDPARWRSTPMTRWRPSPARERWLWNGKRTSRASDCAAARHVLVAVGGGGLIAGVATWFDGRAKVVGVEPEGSRALHAALRGGASRRRTRPVGGGRFAGRAARRRPQLCDLPPKRRARSRSFPTRRSARRSAGFGENHSIIAEPGGAAAYAALAGGAYVPGAGERVGVLLCGANADLAAFAA